jgi:hypothetical protein
MEQAATNRHQCILRGRIGIPATEFYQAQVCEGELGKSKVPRSPKRSEGEKSQKFMGPLSILKAAKITHLNLAKAAKFNSAIKIKDLENG